MPDDEIDLRALYDTLVRGRWIVAAFVAAAVLLAGLFSFVVIPPTYEATARLLAVDPDLQGTVAAAPIKAGTLAVIAHSSAVLTRAARSVPGGGEIDPTEAVDAVVADDNATVMITARGASPAQAAALANAVAGEVAVQTGIVNAAELEHEIAGRIQQAQGSVAGLMDVLASLPKTVATTQSLVEDPALAQIVQERLGLGASEAAALTMTTETINPAWLAVQQKFADLKSQIVDLQAQRAAVASAREADLEAADRYREEVARGDVTPDSLSLQLASARLVAPAVPPEEPASPRKALNMAVAAVLGAILGVFAVFFREFVRNPVHEPKTARAHE